MNCFSVCFPVLYTKVPVLGGGEGEEIEKKDCDKCRATFTLFSPGLRCTLCQKVMCHACYSDLGLISAVLSTRCCNDCMPLHERETAFQGEHKPLLKRGVRCCRKEKKANHHGFLQLNNDGTALLWHCNDPLEDIEISLSTIVDASAAPGASGRASESQRWILTHRKDKKRFGMNSEKKLEFDSQSLAERDAVVLAINETVYFNGQQVKRAQRASQYAIELQSSENPAASMARVQTAALMKRQEERDSRRSRLLNDVGYSAVGKDEM